MKQVISVLFAVLFLFSAVLPGQGISELNKVPELVHHYKQHREKQAETQLSFLDFLKMHYDDESNHKSQEDHDDLPLFHHCSTCMFFINETVSIEFSQQQATLFIAPQYRNNYEHNMHHSIFQPPKFS